MVAALTSVRVRLRNDRAERSSDEFTEVDVDAEFAELLAYARCWANDMDRADRCDLTFSAMLAAMVAHDQPLSRWLRGYFDRLAVPSGDITKRRTYRQPSLYAADAGPEQFLRTTHSFRTALALARELRDDISPGAPVASRHFMAAYAVCPDYHLADFRRYRIDRREWCYSLAAELARQYGDEKEGWIRYRSRAPALLPMVFANDTPDGFDRLHLEREVGAFARLIAARATATPLSIGVFGAWGSGKSFFMRRTRQRVDDLAATAATAPLESEHHSRIAQIEFNAWHYNEGDLIASLVDHVLRNLKIGGEDEDEAAVERRAAEIMALLEDAEQGLASADHEFTDATERVAEAAEALERAEQQLPAAVREAHLDLSDAERTERELRERLHRAEQARDDAAARAGAVATGAVLLREVGGGANGAVSGAADALLDVVGAGREMRKRRKQIVIGAALVVAAAVAATTAVWGQLAAAVTALGAILATAVKLLGIVDQLAERGERFETARAEATEAAVARVTDDHQAELASLAGDLATAEQETAAARQRLEAAAVAEHATEGLAARREELEIARQRRSDAQREVDALHADLQANTIDQRLAAYIEARTHDDAYHHRLGIHSQVRRDFERLSRLMRKATAAHFDDGGPTPTLSRIVLYIDDLDRCPESVVVEVLRAVHLLLAFDLFVCVVAVDPRWLTRCLHSAPGVTEWTADVAAGDLDEQVGQPADPADYIEKIFQIPIWLRPIPAGLRPALVRSWLEDPDTAVPRSSTEHPDGTLTDAELAFLDELAPFLPAKPRTLKRFANTYRLVRTALSDVDFDTFARDPRANGSGRAAVAPYRVCLAQLAALSGDRARALRMITSLDASDAKDFADWLGELKDLDPDLADVLRTVLTERLDLQEFRDWLERTRRYSFYI